MQTQAYFRGRNTRIKRYFLILYMQSYLDSLNGVGLAIRAARVKDLRHLAVEVDLDATLLQIVADAV